MTLGRSLPYSVGLHMALLLLALVGLDWLRKPLVVPEEIIVEIVELDDVTQAPQPDREPQPQPREIDAPKPQPPAPENVKAPPKRVDAVETPPDDAPPTPPEKPAPPERVTAGIPNLSPRQKPKPPARLNTSRVSALLDKRIEEGGAQSAQTQQAPNRSPLETATLLDKLVREIQRQIERCWRVPAGAPNGETLVIRVRLQLNPDGSLRGMPEIQERLRLLTDDYYRLAAESAVSAVQRCNPLRNLPGEHYDLWRDIILTFDPSRMLGP